MAYAIRMNVLERYRTDLECSGAGRMSEIARATGIHLKTLSNLKTGASRNPRIEVYERLRAFYQALDRKPQQQQ